jgi:hypothetical protein
MAWAHFGVHLPLVQKTRVVTLHVTSHFQNTIEFLALAIQLHFENAR